MRMLWLSSVCFCLLLSPIASGSSQFRYLQSQTQLQPVSDEPIDNTTIPSETTNDDQADDSLTNLEYINVLLMDHLFFGNWTSSEDAKPSNFTSSGGLAILSYNSMAPYNFKSSFEFDLTIYDGNLSNQGYVQISFAEPILQIPEENYSNGILVLTNSTVYMTTVVELEDDDDNDSVSSEPCAANVTISFLNKIDGQPFVSTNDYTTDFINLETKFIFESAECNLYFNTSSFSYTPVDETASIIYTLVMSAAAVFQCIVCQYLINQLEQGTLNPRKISLGTIRLLNAFDFYLCLTSLGNFMENSLMIGLAAIPYAVLSLHFEFKLIVVVVTMQSRLSAMDVSKLNFSNCFWLLISMVSVVVSGVYGKPIFIFFAFALSQLPHITQNFLLQQRHRWTLCVLLPFILPKIGYLAYALLVEDNVIRVRIPDSPQLFLNLMVLLILQIILLVAQTRRPSLCKKEHSFYKFYDANDKETIGQEICCICLEKLFEEPTCNTQDTKNSSLLTSVTSTTTKGSQQPDQKPTMVATPCNHSFHEECLKAWIKQKHECPYCRYALPFMPGEDDDE